MVSSLTSAATNTRASSVCVVLRHGLIHSYVKRADLLGVWWPLRLQPHTQLPPVSPIIVAASGRTIDDVVDDVLHAAGLIGIVGEKFNTPEYLQQAALSRLAILGSGQTFGVFLRSVKIYLKQSAYFTPNIYEPTTFFFFSVIFELKKCRQIVQNPGPPFLNMLLIAGNLR